MVHQHFMLVPPDSGGEHHSGRGAKKGLFIDMDKAMEAASNIAKEYNFDINVKDRVEEIPVGIKQKVGNPQGALQRRGDSYSGRADGGSDTAGDGRAVCAADEAPGKGHTIIFISHKLDEIKKSATAPPL